MAKYKLSLKLGDTVITSQADTLFQAVVGLKRPEKITTKAVLTITHGKAKAEVLYNIPRLKRLFFPIARPIVAKQLASLLK